MAGSQSGPEFDIQIGEHGAETTVGVRPPMSGEQIKSFLGATPTSKRPDHISPKISDGDQSYTILRFQHPHFGKYRNIHALDAVEAIERILAGEGAVVKSDGKIQSLHGDNKLFS